MKKQHIILLVIVIFLNSCASKKEHLIFNTVPIDGHLLTFASTLSKLGFIISDSSKRNEIVLNGEFLNKDCKIYVCGTNENNVAYKVIVELPAEVSDSLQDSFEKTQKLYSEKYGNGESRYQQYRNPERLLFNEPRLKRQIRKGDFTRYTTDSGYITLAVRDGYISITYLDKLNNEIRKKEREDENKKENNDAN
jgi:hypothetical protein